MKKDKWRDDWHRCDPSMMMALSGITETPGHLSTMPVSDLNINLQNMPGVSTVYLSGYVIPQDVIPSALEPVGEFVILRKDGDKFKTYNYAFALSGCTIYFNGPFKYFDTHHTALSGDIEIEKSFGHIPPHGPTDC